MKFSLGRAMVQQAVVDAYLIELRAIVGRALATGDRPAFTAAVFDLHSARRAAERIIDSNFPG